MPIGAKLSTITFEKALARAVYSREHVLLLDDVLSGLDGETSQAIYSRLFGTEGLLRRLGSTVVFATHSGA